MSTPIPDRHRLLLAYIARVQQSGDCSYPALEAHLHQHAMALKEQAAREAGDARAAAVAQASEQPAHPDPGQQAIAPATPEAPDPASPEERQTLVARVVPADEGPMQPSVELPAQAPLDVTPETSPEVSTQPSNNTDRAPGPAPMGRPMPAPEVPRTLAGAPGPAPRSGGRTEATAPRAQQAAKARQGAIGTGTGHGLEPLSGKEQPPERTAATPAAPAPSFLPEPQPQLELLLRFRERVQATGLCDHPGLQQRIEEVLRQREQARRPPAAVETGNSQLALHCHHQDCSEQLQQALRSLAQLQQPDAPTDAAIEAVANQFSELRLQLQDGLASYGLPLDPPQRRLLQRTLQRAARREGCLQRRLQRGVPAASLLSELQALAQGLRSAAMQWMPQAEGLLGANALPAEARGTEPTGAAPEPTVAMASIGRSELRRRLLPRTSRSVLNGIRPRPALQAVPPNRPAA